ncbi:hypothetical protein B0H15DRAFT_796748 [Mycena belliarum]|uniref:Uncharacterized protein n=1 Tax=Mycena belliarum TaxID=1033014 RepID=A0AAD6UGW5_9AGAR|nr:hypothetical protein B0H15DRAFT_796748 [Mycena belliae]
MKRVNGGEPLVESDFPQYLQPLYEHGWAFDLSREKYQVGDEPEHFSTLRRAFLFPNIAAVAAFTESTRSAPWGTILIFRNLTGDVILRSPHGVTRSTIRLAIETEAEYQKIVGGNFQPSTTLGPMSTEQTQALVHKKTPHKPRSVALHPITPVALPPAPPAPALPPPSVSFEDLETYIKPLVTNGWRIGGIKPMKPAFREATNALKNQPCMHRTYYFEDYASARHFLHAVTAAIPPPAPNSLAGVEVRLTSETLAVDIWSISELAEDEYKKYGISHIDIRFAIELENEFMKNWAVHARQVAPARKLPTTLYQLWGSSPRTVVLGGESSQSATEVDNECIE